MKFLLTVFTGNPNVPILEAYKLGEKYGKIWVHKIKLFCTLRALLIRLTISNLLASTLQQKLLGNSKDKMKNYENTTNKIRYGEFGSFTEQTSE